MATQLINDTNTVALGEIGGSQVNESVRYGEQELTTEQKAQARTNIGVAGAAEVVYLGSVVGTV